VAPLKPRFPFQEWRTPRHNVDPTPLRYNPDAVRGEVEIEAVVDGRIMFVLKHNSFFYDVICGRDLELQRAHFSSPLPKLPAERWQYQLDTSKKKPRGHVFACPQDQRCQEASDDRKKGRPESLCSWYDLTNEVDEHGFSNARFVIDDYQPGAAAYTVVFQWAVKPYTAEWLAADLRKYGAERVLARMYDWGVAIGVDPQTRAMLEEAGATPRVFQEINRNYRSSNPITMKTH
jgi:hypothetical protein